MTSLTVEDYDLAIQAFLSDMRNLGDDLLSVVLYGSLARGEIRPGKSDILDAYVYLRTEVFEDRERFTRTLKIMSDACGRLSETGIPFHPFHYFAEDELNRLPAVYLPTWKRDERMVLAGEDVRPRIESSAASISVARVSFFNTRRTMGYFLSQYLRKEFPPGECLRVAKGLVSLKKHLLPMACAVLNIWTVSSEALQELQEVLIGIDVSVLEKIDKLNQLATDELVPTEVRQILRETLGFMEQLHDRLLMESANKRELESPLSQLVKE